MKVNDLSLLKEKDINLLMDIYAESEFEVYRPYDFYAKRMGVSISTVQENIKRLRERGCLEITGHIKITEIGRKFAKRWASRKITCFYCGGIR